MTIPVGPGQLYLIDTSAHARSDHLSVRNVIAGLITDRVAATCVTVDLEAGYSGRDLEDVAAIAERRRSLYVNLPISEAIADRARAVQVRMAARELGTTTKKDTVNAALSFVATRRRRIEQLLNDPYALGVGPDISDPEVMRQARR